MIEVDVHDLYTCLLMMSRRSKDWISLTSKMLCQPAVREWHLTRLSTKAHWDLPFHPGPWRKVPKRLEIDVDAHRYAKHSAIWGDFAGCHAWSWKPFKHVLGCYGQWTMPVPHRVITCLQVNVSVSKWRSFAQTCSPVKATWTIVCLTIFQSDQRFPSLACLKFKAM